MQMKGEVHTTANTWIPQCVRQSAGEESAGAIAAFVDVFSYAQSYASIGWNVSTSACMYLAFVYVCMCLCRLLCMSYVFAFLYAGMHASSVCMYVNIYIRIDGCRYVCMYVFYVAYVYTYACMCV